MQKHLEPLPRRQLALRVLLLDPLISSTLKRFVAEALEVLREGRRSRRWRLGARDADVFRGEPTDTAGPAMTHGETAADSMAAGDTSVVCEKNCRGE